MAEPRVKGTTFRSVVVALHELRGESAVTRAYALMAPELSEAYRRGAILSSGWYPISWYRELFRAVVAAANGGPQFARSVGYQSTKYDMAKIHNRLISLFVSPQVLLKFAAGYFSNYYDTGRFEVLESERGHIKARCIGCTGFDQNMWNDIAGSSTALLEGAGAKHVRLHIAGGGHDGDDFIEMDAFWT
jgi:hypothetical protein